MNPRKQNTLDRLNLFVLPFSPSEENRETAKSTSPKDASQTGRSTDEILTEGAHTGATRNS